MLSLLILCVFKSVFTDYTYIRASERKTQLKSRIAYLERHTTQLVQFMKLVLVTVSVMVASKSKDYIKRIKFM